MCGNPMISKSLSLLMLTLFQDKMRNSFFRLSRKLPPCSRITKTLRIKTNSPVPPSVCPRDRGTLRQVDLLYRIISPIISAVGCNIFITQDSPGGSPPGMLMIKGQSCHLSPSQSQVCSCFLTLDVITCQHPGPCVGADNHWPLTRGHYGHLYPLLLQSQAGDPCKTCNYVIR